MDALLIGYGNSLRGDDALGLHGAEAVRAMQLPGVRVVTTHQLTPELAADLVKVRQVVFVDASSDERLDHVEVRRLTPIASRSVDTHIGHPCVLLALAEALYGSCPDAWLVQVPGRAFGYGEALSAFAQEHLKLAISEILHLFSHP